MHSGKVAIIDLDDTLGGLRHVLTDYLNEMTGKRQHWTGWTKLDVESIYGITNDSFLEIAGEKKLLEKSRPHPEAASFMTRLMAAGLHVTVLTARSWHPRASAMTKNWLDLYEIPFHDIVVCSIEDDKADYIRHMDNVLFTVDDSVRHCNTYAAMTENRPDYVFAYDMPWNRKVVDETVIPITNLHQVEKYIEGL